MSVATSLYILIGYCLINGIARNSLHGILTTGKTYGKTATVTRASMNSRSTFPYKDAFNINRRNIGISTASTTSRSTCKTSSSPYSRSDGDAVLAGNRISSSTHSNSNTDVNSHSVKSPYAYNDSTTFHRKTVNGQRRASESESELSLEQQASMELASSHSSDEDTTVHNGSLRVADRRTHAPPPVPPKPSSSYLPNIYDLDHQAAGDGDGGLGSIGPKLMPPDLPPTTCAAGPDVTVGGSPSLRHNIRPLYAQHWSSQLPPAFPGMYKRELRHCYGITCTKKMGPVYKLNTNS